MYPVVHKRHRGGFPDGGAWRLIRATVRYSVGSPGKRKRHRGGFPDSGASRLIRATIRYSVGSPGKRKRHRGSSRIAAHSALSGLRFGIRLVAPVSVSATGEGPGYRVRPPNLNPSRFRAGGLSACCTPRLRTVPPRADRQSAQR